MSKKLWNPTATAMWPRFTVSLGGCWALHAEVKETAGKSTSQPAQTYTSLPRDSFSCCLLSSCAHSKHDLLCHTSAAHLASRTLQRCSFTAWGWRCPAGMAPPEAVSRLLSQAVRGVVVSVSLYVLLRVNYMQRRTWGNVGRGGEHPFESWIVIFSPGAWFLSLWSSAIFLEKMCPFSVLYYKSSEGTESEEYQETFGMCLLQMHFYTGIYSSLLNCMRFFPEQVKNAVVTLYLTVTTNATRRCCFSWCCPTCQVRMGSRLSSCLDISVLCGQEHICYIQGCKL